jgi:hypothetical protein
MYTHTHTEHVHAHPPYTLALPEWYITEKIPKFYFQTNDINIFYILNGTSDKYTQNTKYLTHRSKN